MDQTVDRTTATKLPLGASFTISNNVLLPDGRFFLKTIFPSKSILVNQFKVFGELA